MLVNYAAICQKKEIEEAAQLSGKSFSYFIYSSIIESEAKNNGIWEFFLKYLEGEALDTR